MFTNAMIALFIAGPFGVWVYSKSYSRTGGNKESAMMAAAISAGVAFLVVVTLISLIPG